MVKKIIIGKGVLLLYEMGKCRLGLLLKQRKMTQTELANKLGVTRQQINYYIKDKRKMNYLTALKIASILNCKMEDLYERTPTRKK